MDMIEAIGGIMSLDFSLTRTINSLAGEAPWVDWIFLTLSNRNSLCLPAILLGIYWIWQWPREALIAIPVVVGLIGFVDFVGAHQTFGCASTSLYQHS
jgi:hypothetical protein